MKVTHRTKEGTYVLLAENPTDVDFLGNLHAHRAAKATGMTIKAPRNDGAFEVVSMELSAAPADDLLQTLLKLDRLLRGQPHGQGHVGADAIDPHAQERALAIIKKLNVVLDALGAPIGKAEAAQVVVETHCSIPGDEKAIIGSVQRLATDGAEGGAA